MHEGIAGIVAGKIKDQWQRPVVIVTPSDEIGRAGGDVHLLKGTGRSIDSVNIYEVLSRNSELFIRFGGHSKACGFLMEADNLDRLKKSVNRDMEDQIAQNPDLFEKSISIDAEVSPEEVTVELAKELMKLAPFGEKNPDPVFMMRNVDIRNISYMGADRTHARFSAYSQARQEGAYDDRRFGAECVLFRKAQDMKPLLEGGERVDITGSVSYQVWKGQERVQFIVDEIKRVS